MIDKFICRVKGHRWMITAHVVPIIGPFINRSESNHPLAAHRYGYYGFAEDLGAHPAKILEPLSGCQAFCSRCGEEFNDIYTDPYDPHVVHLEKPVPLKAV